MSTRYRPIHVSLDGVAYEVQPNGTTNQFTVYIRGRRGLRRVTCLRTINRVLNQVRRVQAAKREQVQAIEALAGPDPEPEEVEEGADG